MEDRSPRHPSTIDRSDVPRPRGLLRIDPEELGARYRDAVGGWTSGGSGGSTVGTILVYRHPAKVAYITAVLAWWVQRH